VKLKKQYQLAIAWHVAIGTKNWCSFAPDGDWGLCCKKHDDDYKRGGGRVERMLADIEFRRCIEDKGIELNKIELYGRIAEVYYRFVRWFGWLPWHFKWHFLKKAEKE